MKVRHLILWLSLLLIPSLMASDASFWVWQRTTPLDSKEIAALQQAGTKDLYWQVGTLALHDSHWVWRERFSVGFPVLRKLAPFLHFIPVVRLEPKTGESVSAENFLQLLPILDETVSATGADMMQIDYESPDRLIPEYENFLRSLNDHGRSWHLSITALGHWFKFANDFQGLADEITPMFYDLNPKRESLSNDRLPPLIDAPVVEKQIASWKSCKVPWKAGLPNFCRVSVVNPAGVSRGNIHSWELDELWFSPLLSPLQSTRDGESIFSVYRSGILADTPVHAQEKVIVRYPDLGALTRLKSIAESNGATGTLYFRLADQDDMSGYSVRALSETASGSPTLTVHRTSSGCITITNDSGYDLMPSISTSKERRYTLKLKAAPGTWREAIPGKFAMITSEDEGSHSISNGIGLNVSTISFWFSHLRAGQSLETGLVQNISPTPLRWSVPYVELEPLWHPLE